MVPVWPGYATRQLSLCWLASIQASFRHYQQISGYGLLFLPWVRCFPHQFMSCSSSSFLPWDLNPFYLTECSFSCRCGQLQRVIFPAVSFKCLLLVRAAVKSNAKAISKTFNHAGVLQMECRERYFMIAVGLSFAGDKPRFEAVGESLTGCNSILVHVKSLTSGLSPRQHRCTLHHRGVRGRVWIHHQSSPSSRPRGAQSLLLQLPY